MLSRRCKAATTPQLLPPTHLRKKAAPVPTRPSIGHKTGTSHCLRTHTRNGDKCWSNCSGQTWLVSGVLGSRDDQYRFVCERIRSRLTLIMFPKKVKSSEIALQVTDTRIEVVQKERKPFALFPLLACFLLFLALSCTLSSTAEATVTAYMDVQGNLHYMRGKR